MKCKHAKSYVECGECRAEAVRKGYEWAQSPEGLAEAEQHQQLVRLSRCVQHAAEAMENAQAHVKAGAQVSEGLAESMTDALDRLRLLESEMNRASMGMLSQQIDRQVRASLPPDAEGQS